MASTAPRSRKLAVALGLVACLLAWTAAAIRYSKDGRIEWSLVAAGLFFAALPFMTSKPRTPK